MTPSMRPPRPRLGRPALETNLALLAGLAVTAGLPPFPHTGLLVPAGLALLMVQLVRAERPALAAWVFGLAHQATLLSWLFLLVPAKSIPFDALKYIQAVATILYVSVFYLLLGAAFGGLRRRAGAGRALLLVPVLWTAMELLRGYGELGFPWCLTGAAVAGTPAMALLRTAGEAGTGLLATLLGAAGAAWWLARRGEIDPRAPRLLGAAAGTWLLALAGGALVGLAPPPAATGPDSLRTAPLAVAAIQPDVDLDDKWNPDRIDSTKRPYAALTAEAAARGADLVVWAETAVPAYVRHDPAMLRWLRGVIRETGVALYAGFPDAQRATDGKVLRFNSSGLFTPDGMLQARYPKHHLLPIGEAMPFTRWLPFLAEVDVGQAEWAPGPPPEPLVLPTDRGAFPFSGMICFESVFGHLGREAVRRGSRCLMVITNDGWFGQSAGPRQHAALARLRAAECGVPVVRSANNGISLVCDARGRRLGELGLGRRGLVLAEVAAGPADTPYVRWGLAPVALALAAWTAVVLLAGRRRGEAAA